MSKGTFDPNKECRIRCETPIWVDGMDFPVACRQCKACKLRQQVEWYNRMLFECFGKNYRPMFVTWTFRNDSYLENVKYVREQITLALKRIRAATGPLRGFHAVEAGSKNGRLHGHSIIWSPSIAKMTHYAQMALFNEKWRNGATQVRTVKGPGALWYAAKYITKNLVDLVKVAENGGEVAQGAKFNRHGELINNGRLYSWSNRPILGREGVDRWRYRTELEHAEKPYSLQSMPPNFLAFSAFGILVTAYVPKDDYVKHCKDSLEIVFDQVDSYYDPVEAVLNHGKKKT
jgi:hypothetical protein